MVPPMFHRPPECALSFQAISDTSESLTSVGRAAFRRSGHCAPSARWAALPLPLPLSNSWLNPDVSTYTDAAVALCTSRDMHDGTRWLISPLVELAAGSVGPQRCDSRRLVTTWLLALK